VWTAAQVNVLVNDVIDHESRITTATTNDAKLLAAVPARSTITGQPTTTSTTFTDTGLTVTITPSASSSLVEVSFLLNLGTNSSGVASINLVRAGTNIAQGGNCTMGGVLSSGALSPFSLVFIDAPATTSATIYKLQYKISANTMYINRRGDANDINSISYLSAREIAQ